MIVTNDDQLAENSRSLRNLCFQPHQRFVHDRLGWNLRMTNMQAALGVAQLERLDEFVERKRRMGAIYTKLLSDVNGLQLPLAQTEYAKNIYWVFGLVISEDVKMTADEAIKHLAAMGIGCRPFFYPMHEQPVLRKMGLFENVSLPEASRLYRKGFYIPSGLALTDQQMDTVALALKKIFS
jgi:perosamine synthetase